jgi:uncharacterized membrane protein
MPIFNRTTLQALIGPDFSRDTGPMGATGEGEHRDITANPDDSDRHRHERLQHSLERVERLLQPERRLFDHAEHALAPAWRRVTEGEPRWPASLFVLIAIVLQLVVPQRLTVLPRWLLPALALLLLIGLISANPHRISRTTPSLRRASIVLITALSLANALSAAKLVSGLVRGVEGQDAGSLLLVGSAIWLTNVIVFALWYWELDRGGPVARAYAERLYPDFLFPQMSNPELAPKEWEPGFFDYFYLSFTNATAFSPTDVMPLTRWAKMAMVIQSAISLSTVALVIARAVNILK